MKDNLEKKDDKNPRVPRNIFNVSVNVDFSAQSVWARVQSWDFCTSMVCQHLNFLVVELLYLVILGLQLVEWVRNWVNKC